MVSVREYIEDHLISYPQHKKITPEWQKRYDEWEKENEKLDESPAVVGAPV